MTPPTRFLTTLSFAFLLTLGSQRASAQTVVHSTTGYDVNISIVLIGIVPHTSPCTWGYTYDVMLSYAVTFTGTNPPANMYTLQGTVGCGSSSLFFNLPNGPSSGTITTTGTAWRGVADCSTATLASLGCDEVKVQIQGPGISNRKITMPFTTLPITLVAFDAVATSDGVQLNWTTASEKHNERFTVERSPDALAFSPVLQLPGAGNSSEMLQYAATDNTPLPGISYYRLRQTDIDGTSTLSPVVVVEGHGKADVFSVFPNPSDAPVIELPAAAVGKHLDIHSMTGVLLYSGMLSTTGFQSASLGAGTYLLTVTDPRTGRTSQCRLVRL